MNTEVELTNCTPNLHKLLQSSYVIKNNPTLSLTRRMQCFLFFWFSSRGYFFIALTQHRSIQKWWFMVTHLKRKNKIIICIWIKHDIIFWMFHIEVSTFHAFQNLHRIIQYDKCNVRIITKISMDNQMEPKNIYYKFAVFEWKILILSSINVLNRILNNR